MDRAILTAQVGAEDDGEQRELRPFRFRFAPDPFHRDQDRKEEAESLSYQNWRLTHRRWARGAQSMLAGGKTAEHPGLETGTRCPPVTDPMTICLRHPICPALELPNGAMAILSSFLSHTTLFILTWAESTESRQRHARAALPGSDPCHSVPKRR